MTYIMNKQASNHCNIKELKAALEQGRGWYDRYANVEGSICGILKMQRILLGWLALQTLNYKHLTEQHVERSYLYTGCRCSSMVTTGFPNTQSILGHRMFCTGFNGVGKMCRY